MPASPTAYGPFSLAGQVAVVSLAAGSGSRWTQGAGVVKAVDLLSGAPLTPLMPWWALPEAIRACALVGGWLVRKSASWRCGGGGGGGRGGGGGCTGDDHDADADAIATAAGGFLTQFDDALIAFERRVRVTLPLGAAEELTLLVQTVDSVTGDAVAAIPATPDLDPGFHTGLALLYAADALQEWAGLRPRSRADR